MMERLLPWLQLFRIGNLFTAWADIVAAFLICGFSPAQHLLPLLALLAASSCLYCAGMALNDVADYGRDVNERPERPLPRGIISRKTAANVGMILLVGGVVLASLVGVISAAIALALAVAVVAYDFVLKDTPFGPATMGLCRCLNVCLGLSAFSHALWNPTDLTVPVAGRAGTMVAVGLGLYTMSLTRFARREVGGGGRIELVTAILGMNLGILMLGFAGLALRTKPIWEEAPWPWADVQLSLVQAGDNPWRFAWWIALAGWVNVSSIPAVVSATAPSVRTAVGRLLLGIVLYDAAAVSMFRGPLVATTLVPLTIVSAWIGKRISPT